MTYLKYWYTVTVKFSENFEVEAIEWNIRLNQFTKKDHHLRLCCKFWLVVFNSENLLNLCLHQYIKWGNNQPEDLMTFFSFKNLFLFPIFQTIPYLCCWMNREPLGFAWENLGWHPSESCQGGTKHEKVCTCQSSSPWGFLVYCRCCHTCIWDRFIFL